MSCSLTGKMTSRDAMSYSKKANARKMILHAVQKKIGNFLAKVSNGYENIKQYLLLRTF